jgi:trans-2,3-dihydro-3-hydroxyanthranilate isomerase
MPRLEYRQLDVFTDRPFEGNQLAVFLDGRELDSRAMQTLAREMNFSESTFVLPAERADTDVRMRIFTPGTELPLAGHPTIGTTFALADIGVIRPGADHFVFGLGVGPTRVELRWQDSRLVFAWMDQQLPDVRRPVVSPEDVARAVGVAADSFASTRLPFEEISCGVPYILFPLHSRADVDGAEPEMSALRRLRSAFDVEHVGIYVFTLEPVAADVTAYSRMFAGGLGIAEDPATGSAAGPLGSYLVKHRIVGGDDAKTMVSWQGVAMGRPSRIHVAITSDAAGAITRVQVGGQAVMVAEGTLSY